MASKSSKVLCRACDMVVSLPPFRKHISCLCPQCKSTLRSGFHSDLYNVAVISVASVILMLTSITLPFMTISSMGISQSMSLISIVFILREDWSLLLCLFLLFTFFCPLIMHSIVIGVVFCNLRITKKLALLYMWCHRFSMVDVFVLGVLISLIKLVALAQVEFHSGFYSTLLFALLMVWCFSRGSPYVIWNLVEDQPKENALRKAHVGIRGIDQGLILCRHCGFIYKAAPNFVLHHSQQVCPRCDHSSGIRAHHCYQKTIALLISAVILYIPSNVYPIMFTSYLGSDMGSNIIDGVISLWGLHSYFVAIVILIASICIPIIKILCILLLMYWAHWGFKGNISNLNYLYRIVVFIGRWSMIDVFVVIIMSTVVRMSGLLSISPGLAIICFSGVVLLTMVAAEEFDERLLWDKKLEQLDSSSTGSSSSNFIANYHRLDSFAHKKADTKDNAQAASNHQKPEADLESKQEASVKDNVEAQSKVESNAKIDAGIKASNEANKGI